MFQIHKYQCPILVIIPALFMLSCCAQKIDLNLQNSLATKGTADVLVSFHGGTVDVLSQFLNINFINREIQLSTVTSALMRNAVSLQKEVLELLGLGSLAYKSFWITNQIFIKGANLDVLTSLAALGQVSLITEDEIIKLRRPFNRRTGSRPVQNRNQWGVENIGAPRAWREGSTGAGIIVANIDTGVRYTHEALRSNYLGPPYGWYDPYENTTTPNDEDGHGTHTMGILAGQLGIGVAPGVKWLACKGCVSNGCFLSGLIGCGQFVTCPHLPDGSSPNCKLAPHVVSNSWGGDGGGDFYDNVIDAWTAAGIIPLFSIGNDGPDCGSTNSPGDSKNVIGVGGTTESGKLADFSGTGPTAFGTTKPDLVAPGFDVKSSYGTSDTSYEYLTGSSMAAPNVAGAVAILLSSIPGHHLSFDQVKDYLFREADRNVTSDRNCGGIETFPNNAVGYGKVNVYRSLRKLRSDRSSPFGLGITIGPFGASIRL